MSVDVCVMLSVGELLCFVMVGERWPADGTCFGSTGQGRCPSHVGSGFLPKPSCTPVNFNKNRSPPIFNFNKFRSSPAFNFNKIRNQHTMKSTNYTMSSKHIGNIITQYFEDVCRTIPFCIWCAFCVGRGVCGVYRFMSHQRLCVFLLLFDHVFPKTRSEKKRVV